jgi:hypothetical protein
MKKRGKPRYEEKAIEEKTTLHSKKYFSSIMKHKHKLISDNFSQLMTLWITKAETFYMHPMTLVSTYVQTPHLINVSSLKNRSTPGQGTTKEWHRFVGFPRQRICSFLAAWMEESR